MTYFMALLLALSALFTGPTQAPTEALTQPLTQATQAPLTAPLIALSYEAPTVATSPAPEAPTQAPILALPEAPAQAPYMAPTQPLYEAPTQAPERPTAAPDCMEDMPCWDCTAEDNRICVDGIPQAPVLTAEAPALTADGINPECAEQSMQTAADGSCMTGTECAVADHVLDLEGNCGPRKNND